MPAAAAVVAGKGISLKNVLFVAVALVEPLFRNMRATDATFVPLALHMNPSKKEPFVLSIVATSTLLAPAPVKSLAAAVIGAEKVLVLPPVELLLTALTYMGKLLAAIVILYIKGTLPIERALAKPNSVSWLAICSWIVTNTSLVPALKLTKLFAFDDSAT
jgi:hypothetical protein